MFKIKFRIVDDFKVLESITAEKFDEEYNQILGYIQICFGEHKEGSYYHEKPLREDEEGDEILDYWFDKMLQTINVLDGGHDYVAFIEIEKANRWIEFRKSKDNVLINVATGKARDNKLFITEECVFSYVRPLDFMIEYSEFKIQVYETANKFLMEMQKINPCLLSTKMALSLRKKLELFSK